MEIARRLCAALTAAHDKGVLHRDLKPGNIVINSRGQVLITDFGLAAVAEQVTGPEVRHGTPAYMAPEQLAGKEANARSDIYALGLVLYELCTGRRVFEAHSREELLRLEQASLAPGWRLVPPLLLGCAESRSATATDRLICLDIAERPRTSGWRLVYPQYAERRKALFRFYRFGHGVVHSAACRRAWKPPAWARRSNFVTKLSDGGG